jgi:hypothetical protein
MKTQVHIKQKEFEELVMRRGFSYKDLAEKHLDCSRIYLSNLKNENAPDFRPSGKLRERMLKVLGCQFDDIFLIKQVEDNGAVGAKVKGKKKSK